MTSATLMAAILASCSRGGANFDAAAYHQEVMGWREHRRELLMEPTGYLNQIGLYWLESGTYCFGTAATNDVVFDGNGAPNIGVFTVSTDGVSMTVQPGVDVRSDDQPVEEIVIAADTAEQPVMITHATLAWTIVEREGRYAVRLRDFELPFVASFGPLPYFEVDPAFRVQATLRRYAEPIIANGQTVIEGLEYHPVSPGIVEFEIDGQLFELEAYTVGERLFYVFGDKTNRDATYGAGRFLYSETPGEDGLTILDFNKSYSPPCAFNDFSTCPVASPRNRLPIRIEAGELFDPDLAYSAAH